jgi:hypothetical protein
MRNCAFRACAFKSAVADLNNDIAELGRPEFGWRILRYAIAYLGMTVVVMM